MKFEEAVSASAVLRFQKKIKDHASDQTRKDRYWAAFGWIFISSLAFSIINFLIKTLSVELPMPELIFIRSFLHAMILIPILAFYRIHPFPPGRGVLILRGIMGFGGLTLGYFAIRLLPLSIAATMSWCAPIFVMLISFFFLNERMRWQGVALILGAIAGLILLLSPSLFLDFAQASQISGLGVLLGLCGSFCSAMAYVAVRAATFQFSNHLIVFYFTATATLLSFPMMMLTSGFQMPNETQAIKLLMVGILAMIAQFSLTEAYLLAVASFVSTMAIMSPVLTLLWGWLVLGEILSPSQWLGMAIMMVSIVIISQYGARLRYSPSQVRHKA